MFYKAGTYSVLDFLGQYILGQADDLFNDGQGVDDVHLLESARVRLQQDFAGQVEAPYQFRNVGQRDVLAVVYHHFAARVSVDCCGCVDCKCNWEGMLKGEM